MKDEKPADRPSGDFDSDNELISGNLQNLLDSLRRDGEVIGTGVAEAKITRTGGLIDLDAIDLESDLAEGWTVRFTGIFNDIRFGPDFDLEIYLEMVGANALLPAVFVKYMRPWSRDIRVVGSKGSIETPHFAVTTNAFD